MHEIKQIDFANLAFMIIPVSFTLWILYKNKLDYKNKIYSLVRMLGQLLIVGYMLTFIFNTTSFLPTLISLTVMLLSATFIALRTTSRRVKLFGKALFSIFTVCSSMVMIVVFLVLNNDPWYQPSVLIPLFGMVLTPTMTSVTLLTERYFSDIKSNIGEEEASRNAISASLIPITNVMFAVGLVSFPGMMTGQILAGISPIIAVRYQILVMTMMFSVTGLNSALFLYFLRKHHRDSI